ncbi:hypothetical protein F5883DRAFT_557391 [Diaporthe sp. PMI_573]|nr:hypothetical protein F5883DRAFT_557391 [Diaporthaceae sp. PMI_573]
MERLCLPFLLPGYTTGGYYAGGYFTGDSPVIPHRRLCSEQHCTQDENRILFSPHAFGTNPFDLIPDLVSVVASTVRLG